MLLLSLFNALNYPQRSSSSRGRVAWGFRSGGKEGPIGVSRSARGANGTRRPGHVALLLSISCFSRAGAGPAGLVQRRTPSPLSTSRLALSCASSLVVVAVVFLIVVTSNNTRTRTAHSPHKRDRSYTYIETGRTSERERDREQQQRHLRAPVKTLTQGSWRAALASRKLYPRRAARLIRGNLPFASCIANFHQDKALLTW